MTAIYCTEGGARLDVFLTDETELTRSHIKRLIDGGSVTVNGAVAVKAGQKVMLGDEVCYEDECVANDIIPQDIALDIVYEDDAIAVVNKQRGLVVHPGAGNRDGTLVNALKYRYGEGLSEVGGASRAGIVHRLDKDTTGLMVVARTDFAHRALCGQFAERRVKKLYRAIVDGNFREDRFTVDAPIGRDKRNRLKMAVTPDGRHAVTKVEVLARYKNNCYAQFELCTGRTHQIRVHCAHLKHPVSCDGVYGGSTRLKAAGQLLHSAHLEFFHPVSGKLMCFDAIEPEDFLRAKAILDKESV